jgi:anti-sigma regulatory factor (Ser/Thr protein kinase)
MTSQVPERLVLPVPDLQHVFPGQVAGLEQRRRRRVFPGQAAEMRQLRRWLDGLLPDAPARDDVVLVAVELATNAIKHTASGAGGYFTVEITCAAELGTVRVTVIDGGAAAGPVWSASPDPLDGRGLGLQLVRALAARSGASEDSSGHRVWAEVPWPSTAGEPAPVPVPAAGVNGHKTCAVARQGRAGRSSLHVVSLGTVDGWGRDDASKQYGFHVGVGSACGSWLAGRQHHRAAAGGQNRRGCLAALSCSVA